VAVTLERFDKTSQYQALEQRAAQKAQAARDRQLRRSWEIAAQSWRQLSRLAGERCGCGRRAFGTKIYAGGTGVAYCRDHLGPAIAAELKIRLGLISPN